MNILTRSGQGQTMTCMHTQVCFNQESENQPESMQGFVYLDNLIFLCCKETVDSWGAISRKDQKDIYKVLKIGSSSLLTGGGQD